MIGEFEKISGKDLTVKDFQQTEASIGLSRSVTVGDLRISVKINSKTQGYKVLQSEIV